MGKKAMDPFGAKTKSGGDLTKQQRIFAETFVETGGNRIESVVKAYNIDKVKPGWYNTARAWASENLTKPTICEYITELLGEMKLNKAKVDAKLAYNIEQFNDLSASNKGIDIFNKLQDRYAPTKIAHTFEGLSDEELEEHISEKVAGIISDDGGVRET